MLGVVIRRILVMPLLLLGIVTATFVLAQFTKGNPLVSIIGMRALNNPEIVAAAKARWGLDRSVPERYLVYVTNLAKGDLGTSFRTKQPVLQDLLQRLPATLELVFAAMLVGGVGGIVLGVTSAAFRDGFRGSCRPDHRADRLLHAVFWLGLILLFLFSVKFGVLPGPGRLDLRAAQAPQVTGFLLIDTLLAGDGRPSSMPCAI